MRDDFPPRTKELIAKRVAYRCSNPACRLPTSGPQEDLLKAINVGVAAHITAASPEGPRYDPSLTANKRRSPKNGIWLCQTCAKLIDNDPLRYTVPVLLSWKQANETLALHELERSTPIQTVPANALLPSPTELLDFLQSRDSGRHERISEYLNAVAKEANELAQVWNAAAKSLERELVNPNLATSEVVWTLSNLGKISVFNPQYDKIVLHHRELSAATGGLVPPETLGRFKDALGNIIGARNELVKLLTSTCKLLADSRPLPKGTLEKIGQTLGTLHSEAAALDVLTRVYKVTGYAISEGPKGHQTRRMPTDAGGSASSGALQ